MISHSGLFMSSAVWNKSSSSIVTNEDAAPSVDNMLTELDQLANAFQEAKVGNQPTEEILTKANELKLKLEAAEKSDDQTAKYNEIVAKLK